MGPAVSIMTSTAMITASTITTITLLMPTAVITESSENTMSTRTICTMVSPSWRRGRFGPSTPSSSSPATLARISTVAL
jgi:hypothetical protein